MPEIYYIGGASCSGKTTLAKTLADKYDMRCFHVDDELGEFAEDAIRRECPVALKHSRMDLDSFYMRDPEVQAEELIAFYHEIFPAVMRTIAAQFGSEESVIAEGCAFLPELMKEAGVDSGHYRCMIADESFRNEHFREREWVDFFLAECKDKEKAFSLWMQREALFAEKVRTQALALGYEVYRNNNSPEWKINR